MKNLKESPLKSDAAANPTPHLLQALLPAQIKQQFQEGSWGKTVLRWTCDDAELPDRLQDALCINGHFRQHVAGRQWGDVQIAKHAAQGTPQHNQPVSNSPETQAPDAAMLRNCYENGYSIITNNLQERSKLIASLCTQLAASFHCGVNCNAYLTPPDAQALQRHYDDEDIIVVQLSGQKRWNVWLPGEPQLMPLVGLPYSSRCADSGAPLLDTVMQPGDCLYLPAGYAHAAQTEGGPSLHITFSMAALCVADLLVPLLRQRMFNAQAGYFLRCRLPLSLLEMTEGQHMQAALEELRSGFVLMGQSMSLTELQSALASHTHFNPDINRESPSCPT